MMAYYKNNQTFHPRTNFKLISLNALQKLYACRKILGAKIINLTWRLVVLINLVRKKLCEVSEKKKLREKNL